MSDHFVLGQGSLKSRCIRKLNVLKNDEHGRVSGGKKQLRLG